jgi:hypothetical protein
VLQNLSSNCAARSRWAIDRLFRSFNPYVDGRTSITKVFRYILGQREPLELFLTDAAVPIHNNLGERVLGVEHCEPGVHVPVSRVRYCTLPDWLRPAHAVTARSLFLMSISRPDSGQSPS